MRVLCKFRPRLIGRVMTGHIRRGSHIDLHVFSDSVNAVTKDKDRHFLFLITTRRNWGAREVPIPRSLPT
jgi:hypothetical protein